MTEQQKKAVEEAATQYALKAHQSINDIGVSDIKALVYDYMSGMHQVLNNPEKYGLQPINEWVSVKDRLPCESGRYWCYVQEQNDLGTSHFQWNCYFANDTKEFSDQFERYNVIHWQPLPQPPINEREEE